ncbi:MAG: hypothetical protein IPN29_14855 [Saprospiraceae bacterium]|nr:hypothetical protein [Saprospiraceae bacterium]
MKFPKIGTLMVVLWVMFSLSCVHTNQEESAPKIMELSSRAANERQIAFVTYGTDPDAQKWFTYDAAGQLIRAGAYIDTIFFTYKRDSIVKYYADKNNHWDASIGYALDKNGRVISSSIRDDDYNEISNYRFVYDGNGYLVRTSEQLASTGSSFVNQFAYIGGNLSEIKCFSADGRLSSRYLYDYYPDKVNDLNLFLHSITDDHFTHERLGRKMPTSLSP